MLVVMKRLTVNIDDRAADMLASYSAITGVSQSAVVRSLLAAITPTFEQSVALYRRAQDAGTQSVQVLQRAAEQMEIDVMPKQQQFLRDWNALIAKTSEEVERAAHGGHDELANL